MFSINRVVILLLYASQVQLLRFAERASARRFARDAETLRSVGRVLLPPQSAARCNLRRWLVAADAFSTCEVVSQAIYEALSKNFEAVTALLGHPTEVNVREVPRRLKGSFQSWIVKHYEPNTASPNLAASFKLICSTIRTCMRASRSHYASVLCRMVNSQIGFRCSGPSSLQRCGQIMVPG
jgi:hypothetical protein